MILLFIYILVIYFGQHHFTIHELGIFLIMIGGIGSLLQFRNITVKTLFQPISLMVIGIASIIIDDMFVLRSFPLLLSIFFFLAFIYADITKDFFLISTIEKFKKLDKAERIYLEKTHTIWIFVTAINVCLHIYFLFFTPIVQWTFYISIGWYILLGCGILFQIGFRKFYEHKITH